MQETIEKIKYLTKAVPEKEFRTVIAHLDEAKPYLYDSIRNAIDHPDEIIADKDYMLHMYSLYLLAEAGDQDAFPLIIQLVSLSPDTVDDLLGDVVTGGLNDILYSTFDGDVSLLINTARNDMVGEYVRTAVLEVLGQLYRDGIFEEKEWKHFLKGQIYKKTPDELFEDTNDNSFFYTSIAAFICQCHIIDLLPDVQYLFLNDLVDTFVYGEYDSCVDMMFDYSREEPFCNKIGSAVEELRGWAMYEDNRRDEKKDAAQWKNLEKAMNILNKPVKKVKIGRNDPCPCGSGRKYKQCCLNKPKSEIDQIESEEERRKWLQDYPEITSTKQEGRIYLDDFYDAKSIEIDKYIYLALKHRAIPIWEMDREKQSDVPRRMTAYLWKAFELFQEKMELEKIRTAREYDENYSIHYTCYQFLNTLHQLLEQRGDQAKCRKVEDAMETYQV